MLRHQDIEERGMVEAYVRRQLAPEDCAAFEEHYFQCAECFDDVQVTEKLVQGVDYAVRSGMLDRQPAPNTPRKTWLLPAFAFAGGAAAVLAVALIYAVMPHPTPEANVPVVILTASRSADAPNQLQFDSQSRRALLWIDVPEQPPGTRFEVTVSAPGFSQTIHGLERNANGALAAGLPATDLAPGTYNIRLFNEKLPGQLVAEYRLNVERR